jgi:transposase
MFNPDLPVREVICILPEEERFDENGEHLFLIGYEKSYRLNYHREVVEVICEKRAVYGRKDSREYVKVAAPKNAIIKKGKLTDEFITQLVFDKFINGMPLNRQMKKLNFMKADLSKSTLSDAILKFSLLYVPLVAAIKAQIFSSKYIHADESPLKFGQGKNQKFKNGYVFVYQDKDQIYFFYGGSRQKSEIKSVLCLNNSGENIFYMGNLMCDGYAGYNIHAGKLMACWAHVRRKFYAIADNNASAMKMLNLINRLYKIERSVKKKAIDNNWSDEKLYDELFIARQEKSRKVIDQIHEKLLLLKKVTPPSGSMGKAITYTLNQWPGLDIYLEDGELPIDNNPAENGLRPMVIGRKNYLFAGSLNAGKAAANCYTIVESCKKQGLDPLLYMNCTTPILLENRENPDFDYSQLTPKNIKKDFEKYQIQLAEKEKIEKENYVVK